MQQKDGTIHRRTSGDNGFVTDTSDWVLSGPHFFLANPFNKTPRRVCTANGHYDQSTLRPSLTTTCRAPTTAQWQTVLNTCGGPQCEWDRAREKTWRKPVQLNTFRQVNRRDDVSACISERIPDSRLH